MERIWPKSAKLTENDVSEKGWRAKERIDSSVARAISYLVDPNKKDRIEKGLCKLCFYSGSKISGAAMTKWNCRACLQNQGLYGCLAVPEVCDKCSKKYSLCKECGSDIHLRVRRNNTNLLDAP